MKKLMKGFVAALVVMLGIESAQAWTIVTNGSTRTISMKVGETAKDSYTYTSARWLELYGGDATIAVPVFTLPASNLSPSNRISSAANTTLKEFSFTALKVGETDWTLYRCGTLSGATATVPDYEGTLANNNRYAYRHITGHTSDNNYWANKSNDMPTYHIVVEAVDPVVPGDPIPTTPATADADAATMNADKKTYLKAPNNVEVEDDYYDYFTAVPDATKTAIFFVLNAEGSNAVAKAQSDVKPEIPLADIANAATGETFAPDAMAGFYYTLVQGDSLDSMTAGDPKLAGDSGFSFTAQKQGNLGYYRFIVSPYDAKPTDLTLDADGTNTVAAYGFKESGVTTVKDSSIREAVVAAWASQAADGGEIKLDDLVDKGSFAEGDKIYAYKAGIGSYEGWVLNASGEWEVMTTIKVGAWPMPSGATQPDEKTFKAGEVFWAERANATKPLLLCGGIATDAALPALSTGANLIGAAGFKAVDLDAAFPTPAADDRVTLPIPGKQPRTYSFKEGKWGYKASEKSGDVVVPKWTEDGKLPAGAGFWYKKANSDPS